METQLLRKTGDVRCTFFGTTSLYITDGNTAIFLDAFLTRPAFDFPDGKIAPDPAVIRQSLADGGVDRLDALFVAHSHFDHVMDSPEVIKQIGGKLYGSRSSLNVGRGADLGEDSLIEIKHGDSFSIGAFRIDIFQGLHSPGNISSGNIEKPIMPPAKASSYADGGCFSFHIHHQQGNLFIHPSANFVQDQFTRISERIDVMYLSIGTIGLQSPEWQEQYWRNTVDVVRPSVIVPIHWDNFFLPLSEPLQPLPQKYDNFEATKNLIERKTSANTTGKRQRVIWQDRYETILPFKEV